MDVFPIVKRAPRLRSGRVFMTQLPYIDEYTSHLQGAPKRRHEPLLLLTGVGATAAIAAVMFVFMILSMVF